MYHDKSEGSTAVAPATRDFTVYTLRLPLTLARALQREAERRFEPQSVIVRRLVAEGLNAGAAE